jgi:AAA+ ATPase superfamily predicted ATPase
MAHDIFISYSSKDKETADAVCDALEQQGIRCWITPRDILPGVKYAEAIVDAISACKVFLLILSASSNDSPQVGMEVDRAASKDIPILSFRTGNFALSKSLEYYLSSRHWLDASTGPVQNQLPNLIQTLHRLLPAAENRPAPKDSVPQAQASSEDKTPPGDLPPTEPANPFSFGNPIRDANRFYGRTQEIRQVLNRLLSSAHESTSIVGERRIGKTSLLAYLSDPAVAPGLGLTPDKYCLVFVDFQGLTDITPKRFWQRVLGKISQAIGDPKLNAQIQTLDGNSAFDLYDLEDVFKCAASCGRTIVLFMDEFEYITQNSKFGGDFFGGLRALAIHQKLALVTASHRELIDVCHSPDLNNSPFFNIFATVVLHPFSRAEVDDLLRGYLPSGPSAFSAEDCETIWRLAGGYPFFVQMAGYYLREGKLQGESGAGLREYAESRYEQQAKQHFSYLWTSCSDGEKIILLAIQPVSGKEIGKEKMSVLEALRRARGRTEQDLASLVKRGLVGEVSGGYAGFSQAFERWIKNEILAAVGEEESNASVQEWLRSDPGPLRAAKALLPKFKKKYWPLLGHLSAGLPEKMDSQVILKSLL